MSFHSLKVRVVVAAVVLVVTAAAAPLAAATGRLWVVIKVADNIMADSPARASIVTPDGTLVDYAEELLAHAPNTQSFLLEQLEPGLYDVRVESEGAVTEVKKGVPIFADRDERVSIVIRPGQGVHIVEYAVAGLSREEVAVRLAKLEAAIEGLKADLEAMRAKP